MANAVQRQVQTAENGQLPYGQTIAVRRHVLNADEPDAQGGRDSGPDPYELVLAGLAACTSMTIRMYAARKGWPLAGVAVRAKHLHVLGADGRPRDRFEREVELVGDLSAGQRARLVSIADRCPVSQTLSRGSEVTVTETGAVAATG